MDELIQVRAETSHTPPAFTQLDLFNERRFNLESNGWPAFPEGRRENSPGCTLSVGEGETLRKRPIRLRAPRWVAANNYRRNPTDPSAIPRPYFFGLDSGGTIPATR
jgi:hypothetical protein